jgi:hypothetical protein
MAQYAILVYADDSAHAPEATPADLERYNRRAEELAESGAALAVYALTPRDMATSMHGDAITDGPFVDAKEVVAGFYVVEAPDLDAVMAIARLDPVWQGGGALEIRPVHSSWGPASG